MCDICVLYLLKKKYFYRNQKYQYVDDPDASGSEDEASFPVGFFQLYFLSTVLNGRHRGIRKFIIQGDRNGPFPIRQTFKFENNFSTVGKSFLNLVKL